MQGSSSDLNSCLKIDGNHNKNSQKSNSSAKNHVRILAYVCAYVCVRVCVCVCERERDANNMAGDPKSIFFDCFEKVAK